MAEDGELYFEMEFPSRQSGSFDEGSAKSSGSFSSPIYHYIDIGDGGAKDDLTSSSGKAGHRKRPTSLFIPPASGWRSSADGSGSRKSFTSPRKTSLSFARDGVYSSLPLARISGHNSRSNCGENINNGNDNKGGMAASSSVSESGSSQSSWLKRRSVPRFSLQSFSSGSASASSNPSSTSAYIPGCLTPNNAEMDDDLEDVYEVEAADLEETDETVDDDSDGNRFLSAARRKIRERRRRRAQTEADVGRTTAGDSSGSIAASVASSVEDSVGSSPMLTNILNNHPNNGLRASSAGSTTSLLTPSKSRSWLNLLSSDSAWTGSCSRPTSPSKASVGSSGPKQFLPKFLRVSLTRILQTKDKTPERVSPSPLPSPRTSSGTSPTSPPREIEQPAAGQTSEVTSPFGTPQTQEFVMESIQKGMPIIPFAYPTSVLVERRREETRCNYREQEDRYRHLDSSKSTTSCDSQKGRSSELTVVPSYGRKGSDCSSCEPERDPADAELEVCVQKETGGGVEDFLEEADNNEDRSLSSLLNIAKQEMEMEQLAFKPVGIRGYAANNSRALMRRRSSDAQYVRMEHKQPRQKTSDSGLQHIYQGQTLASEPAALSQNLPPFAGGQPVKCCQVREEELTEPVATVKPEAGGRAMTPSEAEKIGIRGGAGLERCHKEAGITHSYFQMNCGKRYRALASQV